MIHAAGFFPYAIVGGSANLEKANSHLQAWACSHSRSALARALDGELDFLDGLIIPHTCDTMRMLLDLWQHLRPLPYMENYRLPRQVSRVSAKQYLLSELARIKKGLELYRGSPIGVNELQKSINLYNQNRQLLRRLTEFHNHNPGLITSRQLYSTINAAMIMPREEVNNLLKIVLENLKQKPINENNYRRLPLLMSGTLLEPMEVLDYLEEFGGTVIADDFQNGYRYIETDVNTAIEPLEALAERQLKRIPSAAFDINENPRRFFLTSLAKENNVMGAIFLHLTFCEPENFDSYDNLKTMQAEGFPAIRIETQFGNAGLGQIRTRIHAFMEMIGGESL